jgi:hypothetical protein
MGTSIGSSWAFGPEGRFGPTFSSLSAYGVASKIIQIPANILDSQRVIDNRANNLVPSFG